MVPYNKPSYPIFFAVFLTFQGTSAPRCIQREFVWPVWTTCTKSKLQKNLSLLFKKTRVKLTPACNNTTYDSHAIVSGILTVFLLNLSGFEVKAKIATSFSLAGCWIIASESDACKIHNGIIHWNSKLDWKFSTLNKNWTWIKPCIPMVVQCDLSASRSSTVLSPVNQFSSHTHQPSWWKQKPDLTVCRYHFIRCNGTYQFFTSRYEIYNRELCKITS
jgi:hypothetical protein